MLQVLKALSYNRVRWELVELLRRSEAARKPATRTWMAPSVYKTYSAILNRPTPAPIRQRITCVTTLLERRGRVWE